MEPMIKLENIEKYYESGVGKTFVLRRITLDMKEGEFVTLRLPSTEVRMVRSDCSATIGQVGNVDHELIRSGKAGRSAMSAGASRNGRLWARSLPPSSALIPRTTPWPRSGRPLGRN